MEPDSFFNNLELVLGLCVAGAALCIFALFSVPLMLLIARKNSNLRKAAASWLSVPGRVVESKVVMSRALHLGMTMEEADAKVRAQGALPAAGPERLAGIVLGLLDDPLDLALPQTQAERSHWPLVVYEYEVNGVKYINNQVGADEVGGPTRGGFVYSDQVVKRYPVGSAITVFVNPQNVRQSALER